MGTTVKILDDILQHIPSKEELEAYEDFKKIKTEDITDIPELTQEQLVMAVKARQLRKELYKPVKIPVKINYDADILEWFRSLGKGYQTKMNTVLREYMLAHLDK
ncbi:MAG: BrnA antitoxin family protein [Treponema sp.]|nr:BrnA antitoxin family protein [Treponema sp.]